LITFRSNEIVKETNVVQFRTSNDFFGIIEMNAHKSGMVVSEIGRHNFNDRHFHFLYYKIRTKGKTDVEASIRLRFHNFHNFSSLVITAVSANMVRSFDLMTLWTIAERRHAQFIMGPPHPSSGF